MKLVDRYEFMDYLSRVAPLSHGVGYGDMVVKWVQDYKIYGISVYADKEKVYIINDDTSPIHTS